MKLKSLLALCIVTLAACSKKDNTTTEIVKPATVSLPVKVWYYVAGTDYTDAELSDNSLYTYDTIYYNSKNQVEKVVMYLVDSPADSVVYQFEYNSDGNLTMMSDYSTNSSYVYGQNYYLYYNSAKKVDSIDISSGLYTDWYGIKMKYDSKDHLESINAYQAFGTQKLLWSKTEFHTNSSNLTDSVKYGSASSYNSVDGVGPFSNNTSYFPAYNPNDTASMPAAYLFKLAASKKILLFNDFYYNGFLFQFLSPKDMLLFRNAVSATSEGLAISNVATRSADKALESYRSYFRSTSGKDYLLAGIKVQNGTFYVR